MTRRNIATGLHVLRPAGVARSADGLVSTSPEINGGGAGEVGSRAEGGKFERRGRSGGGNYEGVKSNIDKM